MTSLVLNNRAQLVKCFITLLLKTLIFFVVKIKDTFALDAFAMQKLLTFFQQKILAYFIYLCLKF